MSQTNEWCQIVEAVMPTLTAVCEDKVAFVEATTAVKELGVNLPSDVMDFLIDSIWERDADIDEFNETVGAFSRSKSAVEFRAYMSTPVQEQ